MPVTVRSLAGHVLCVHELMEDPTVAQLKDVLSAKLGVAHAAQRLLRAPAPAELVDSEKLVPRGEYLLVISVANPDDPFVAFQFDFPANPVRGTWDSDEGDWRLVVEKDTRTGRLGVTSYETDQPAQHGWACVSGLDHNFFVWRASLRVCYAPGPIYEPHYPAHAPTCHLEFCWAEEMQCLAVEKVLAESPERRLHLLHAGTSGSTAIAPPGVADWRALSGSATSRAELPQGRWIGRASASARSLPDEPMSL